MMHFTRRSEKREELFTFILPASAQQSLDFSTQLQTEFAGHFQYANTSLTDKQAAVISDYVQKQLLAKNAGIYDFDHFSFEFANEKIEHNKFSFLSVSFYLYIPVKESRM